MERVYSAEQIKAALASGRKDDIEEVREAMQQLIEAKEDSKTEGTDVKVGDPESLIEQDGLGESPPLEKKGNQLTMSNVVQQQQAKLKLQGDRFAQELATVGGPDPSQVAKKIAFLYSDMNRAMSTLTSGRAQLAVAEGNQRQSVGKVREKIYEDTELRANAAMVQVRRNYDRDSSAFAGVVAGLPARPEGVSDAVLLSLKVDLIGLLEQQKNPKDIYIKALDLAQSAVAAHDMKALFVLASDLMTHVFERLVLDQAKELRERLFAILADSYPEKHALTFFPEISSSIVECGRIVELELRELQKEA